MHLFCSITPEKTAHAGCFLFPHSFLRGWGNRTASAFPEVVGKQAKTSRCGVWTKRVTKTKSNCYVLQLPPFCRQRRQSRPENYKGMQNDAKRLAAITTSLPHKGIPILADSHIIKPIPISNTEALCMTDFSPPDFPFASSGPAVLSLPTIF